MDEKKKTKLIVILIGCAIGLLVIALAIFSIIKAKYSASLDILVAPLSAKITIDGNEYQNGLYKFEPGEVVATITKEGFYDREIALELKVGETAELYTYLLPLEGNYDWYIEHEEDMMILNTIGDATASKKSLEYLIDNPIVEVLPIIYANYDANWDYTEYRVDGGSFDDCNLEFCLKITDTTGGNYEAALESVRAKGFDPDKYEIIYEYKPIVPLR